MKDNLPSNAMEFYNKVNRLSGQPTDVRVGIESTAVNDPIDTLLNEINSANLPFIESGYITSQDPREIKYNSIQNTPLQGALEESGISDLFFSNKNVNTIVQTVRYKVYEKNTKYIIDPPNINDTYLIMRDTFLHADNGKYLAVPETEIIDSIKSLNTIVINKIVSNILSNIKSKERYLNDISSHNILLDPPKSTSTKYTFNSTNIPGYVIPDIYTGGEAWSDPCINYTGGHCE